MIEFTKQELNDLKSHVDASLAQDDETEGLLDKIEAMIKNLNSLDSIRERTLLHGGVNK